MDSEDSFNPQAEQEQERLVLQSILMDEFHVPSKVSLARVIIEEWIASDQ